MNLKLLYIVAILIFLSYFSFSYGATAETAPSRAAPFAREIQRGGLGIEAISNTTITDTSAIVRLHNLAFTRAEYGEVRRELVRKIAVRRTETLTLQQLLMWAEMARREMRECKTSWTFAHVPTLDEMNDRIKEQCL